MFFGVWLAYCKIFLNRVDRLHILKACIKLFACPVAVLFYAQQTTKKMDLA